MAGKNTSVYGIYRNRIDLEHAVDVLRAEGFRSSDISVLFPDNEGTKDFAHEKHTKAPEGTATGAGTGAVLGGVLGWLTGIGALAIPGVGPFIAAGPIMAALAGAGVGGTLGGLTGALIGAGIPEYEAKRYEGRVREGGILLSVHAEDSDWTKKAKDILERTGAMEVSSASEASAKGDRDDDTRDDKTIDRRNNVDDRRDVVVDRPGVIVDRPNTVEVPPDPIVERRADRVDFTDMPADQTPVRPDVSTLERPKDVPEDVNRNMDRSKDIEIDRPSGLDRPNSATDNPDAPDDSEVTITIHKRPSRRKSGSRSSDRDRPVDPDAPADRDTDLP